MCLRQTVTLQQQIEARYQKDDWWGAEPRTKCLEASIEILSETDI